MQILTYLHICRAIGKYAEQVRMLLREVGQLVLIPSAAYYDHAGSTLEKLMKEVMLMIM